jgi:hypothetical protein
MNALKFMYAANCQRWWCPLIVHNTPDGIGAVQQMVNGNWVAVPQFQQLGNMWELRMDGTTPSEIRVNVSGKSSGSAPYGVYVVTFASVCGGGCPQSTVGPSRKLP